jgi:hypothetical protein
MYQADGEMYAGWAVGRWFALAGVAALAIATVGYSVTHGFLLKQPAPSDQMFASLAEWVGAGLGMLMAVAAWGSIMIQQAERGDVEVTELGVRRILRPGREEFFRREEIAGFVVRMGGGVTLVGCDGRRAMVIPRSIYGYRECIAELKAMGLTAIPADQVPRRLRQGMRSISVGERILSYVMIGIGSAYFEKGISQPVRAVLGLMVLAWVAVMIVREARWRGRMSWSDWVIGAGALAVVIWFWPVR